MKNDWLTASSLERTFEVVSAINILLIHSKFALTHSQDPTDPGEIQKAKAKLMKFLGILQSLIENAERNQTGLIVGTDSRLGELALQYGTEQKRVPQPLLLYTLSFPDLYKLIDSDRPDDLEKLVKCLDSLRSLFELYSRADIAGIFGDE
jgi:hypothetical protein